MITSIKHNDEYTFFLSAVISNQIPELCGFSK